MATSSQINIPGCLVTRTSSRQNLHHHWIWEHSVCRKKGNFSAGFFQSPDFCLSLVQVCPLGNWLTLTSRLSHWGTQPPATQPDSALSGSNGRKLCLEIGWAWASSCWASCQSQSSALLGEVERAGRGRIRGIINVNDRGSPLSS